MQLPAILCMHKISLYFYLILYISPVMVRLVKFAEVMWVYDVALILTIFCVSTAFAGTPFSLANDFLSGVSVSVQSFIH